MSRLFIGGIIFREKKKEITISLLSGHIALFTFSGLLGVRYL